MDSLITDLRYALRMLVKTPGLSAVAILTIALGVGLTTHTFSIVYGSVIRGIDFDRGTALVNLSEDVPSQDRRGNGIPILDLIDWREQQTAFRGLGAFSMGTINLADEESRPERFNGAFVSASLFAQVDGVPILGRVFNPEEDAGTGEPVVILGYNVWQNRYAGDPDIVGKSVRANAKAATVVGVMPEGFHFPMQEEVWLPLNIDPLEAQRGDNRVAVVGRLREGVSMEQADVQMQEISRRIAEAYPEANEGVGVWVQTFEDLIMPPEIVNVLWIMLGAVLGVLLIACFNVANLLLARALVRSKEVAVRSALGADRPRLIRQLLIEAGVLAVVGGALGVVIAYFGIDAFNASIADIDKPYWIDIRLDGPAVAFTLGITALAALVAGTLPALRASGGQVHDILKDEGKGSSSLRMGRFSTALVIGEIALSSALLVAAGMMIKSVINVNTVDMGFEGEHVFTARLGLFESDYPDDEARVRFFDRLVEELSAEPGVEAAGLTTNLPALGAARPRVAIEGVTYADVTDQPFSSLINITPGYLDALSVPTLEGRDFGIQDRMGALPTAIVNESFGRKHFGSETPIGRRVRVGEAQPWMTIVGLVPDIFIGAGGGPLDTGVSPDQFFVPIAQQTAIRFVSLTVKTRGEPGLFAATARDVVARIDPDLPLYWVRTMEESVETATWVFLIFGSLFTTFGVAALFLAAVGLYGVMAFSVSRRTQEMGVRMAMGAGTGDVMRLILGKGMKQLGIGTVLGLLIGAAMVRPLATVFFDVNPSDPTVYAAIVLTLGLAGLVACLVPARRATLVEVVEALRPQ
ncbi:MAG: ABC transporter permease [Gemmatimonadota bacterium]|nr:MAG: ABC transporter permease [Gemmatimonadota bacterium]